MLTDIDQRYNGYASIEREEAMSFDALIEVSYLTTLHFGRFRQECEGIGV